MECEPRVETHARTHAPPPDFVPPKRRKRGRPFEPTPEFWRDWAQGMSHRDLAAKYGTSPASVGQAPRPDRGRATRGGYGVNDKMRAAPGMLARGESVMATHRALKVDPTTIRRWKRTDAEFKEAATPKPLDVPAAPGVTTSRQVLEHNLTDADPRVRSDAAWKLEQLDLRAVNAPTTDDGVRYLNLGGHASAAAESAAASAATRSPVPPGATRT